MTQTTHTLPVVLAIGGHDPGGGAGIQADIESIGANGCHATTVITCLTVQDSCNVNSLIPIPPDQVIAQMKAVFADCNVVAIKIGLIGDAVIAEAMVKLLRNYPEIPLVFDPVLAAGGGNNLTNSALLDTILSGLIPLCSLITPNSIEARRLTNADLSLEACAQLLIAAGSRSVLITGTHEDTVTVSNHLYSETGLLDESHWERLPGEYHGSGCTLASAIAAGLARGLPLVDAVRCGQAYSWKTLQQGFRSGRCQSLPDRLFVLQRYPQ